jgi:hypothetical protein
VERISPKKSAGWRLSFGSDLPAELLSQPCALPGAKLSKHFLAPRHRLAPRKTMTSDKIAPKANFGQSRRSSVRLDCRYDRPAFLPQRSQPRRQILAHGHDATGGGFGLACPNRDDAPLQIHRRPIKPSDLGRAELMPSITLTRRIGRIPTSSESNSSGYESA